MPPGSAKVYCAKLLLRKPKLFTQHPVDVDLILIVFLANVLDQFTIQHCGMRGEFPGLRVSAGIVDGVLNLQMTQVRAAESLRDHHLVGVGVTVFIQPGGRILTNGLDHESVISCDNILTVPTSTLGPRIGYLQPAQELELAESIRAACDLA